LTVPPAFEATTAFAHQLVQQDCGGSRHGFHARWMRLFRPLHGVPKDALDPSTGLYNRAGLFAAADEETARRRDATTSAVLLEFPDLHEVREIYGATIARKVVAKLVRRLRALAGLRGIVGRTGPAQFTIVFPGMTPAHALSRLHRTLGRPARIEFDAGDSEIVLLPEFAVDAVEPGAGPVQELYRDMAMELARIQKDERRRLHQIASERERHSRPMGIRH
jgi:GGDEF domain-containing protein